MPPDRPGTTSNPLARIFPERRIAPFVHRQDRLLFFSLVNELVGPQDVVLDFGAGRNRFPEYGRHLEMISTFRGRCAKVIGVDVDEVVLTNETLDEAHVIEPGRALPLPDDSVDVVFSYAVLEHVEDPVPVARELARVVKPGGWICAWTPNKWGYIGIGARLVPSRAHARLLTRAQPRGRRDADVFPTHYRMNTRTAIARLFPSSDWDDRSFTFNAQPSYNFGSAVLARLLMIFMALTPRRMGQGLFVFLRRRDGELSVQ